MDPSSPSPSRRSTRAKGLQHQLRHLLPVASPRPITTSALILKRWHWPPLRGQRRRFGGLHEDPTSSTVNLHFGTHPSTAARAVSPWISPMKISSMRLAIKQLGVWCPCPAQHPVRRNGSAHPVHSPVKASPVRQLHLRCPPPVPFRLRGLFCG